MTQPGPSQGFSAGAEKRPFPSEPSPGAAGGHEKQVRAQMELTARSKETTENEA